MKIAYIVWRDACYCTDEVDPRESDLVELHEIGFVVHETSGHITLTMEYQENAKTCRFSLAIPRVNIVKAVYLEPSKLTNDKRRSSRKSNDRVEGGAPGALREVPPQGVRDDQLLLRRPRDVDPAS